MAEYFCRKHTLQYTPECPHCLSEALGVPVPAPLKLGEIAPDRIRVVSDGTVVGTRITHADSGEFIPCTRAVWEMDAQVSFCKLTLYLSAAPVDICTDDVEVV